MNEPMFTTRIYKTDKGWSFENILTDVLPKDVNTFCSGLPKHLAWKEMMYYLNRSSKMIQRIKDRTDEDLFRLQVILSNGSSYDYAVMARDFHTAVEDVLCKLENSPNTTYFSVKRINLYETVNGARQITRQLSLD